MSRRDCICDQRDMEILEWIQNQTLPSEALMRSCCWRRICQVRGRHFDLVEPETWSDICRERGYLYARQNPRGF
jgi:hypothetical protein